MSFQQAAELDASRAGRGQENYARGFSQHVALWSSGCCLPARDGAVAEPAGERWGMGGGYEMLGSGALLRAQLR